MAGSLKESEKVYERGWHERKLSGGELIASGAQVLREGVEPIRKMRGELAGKKSPGLGVVWAGDLEISAPRSLSGILTIHSLHECERESGNVQCEKKRLRDRKRLRGHGHVVRVANPPKRGYS